MQKYIIITQSNFFEINSIYYLYNWDATPDFSAAESLNMSRINKVARIGSEVIQSLFS